MITRAHFLIYVFCLSIGVAGCSGNKKADNKTKIIVAERKKIETHLYYSGVIEPILLKPILSPVEGVIKALHFEYGQRVKKGDFLLSIYSRQIQDTYRNTLITYLTAKRTYQDSVVSFEGTKVLHEAKIVSDEEFKNEQSRVDANRLAAANALYSLEQALSEIPGQKIPEFKQSLEELSFKQMSQIEEILDRKLDVIKIYSPGDGVALLPKKGEGGEGGGQEKEVYEGGNIKKGEAIASLGDLSGLSIFIKVNEIDINRLKIGQKVELTVPALPGESFSGEIKSISSQAKSDNRSGGLATFPAKVVIKKIPEKQRGLIRIGMSAKVSVSIESQSQIVVPVEAVFDKDGVDMVIMVDKAGKEKPVRVVVGKTNPEGISVISGLKEGDKVLVRD